jgi:hypothetical protein
MFYLNYSMQYNYIRIRLRPASTLLYGIVIYSVRSTSHRRRFITTSLTLRGEPAVPAGAGTSSCAYALKTHHWRTHHVVTPEERLTGTSSSLGSSSRLRSSEEGADATCYNYNDNYI